MNQSELEFQLLEPFRQLSTEQQTHIIKWVQNLAVNRASTSIEGEAAENLFQFIGLFPDDDLTEIQEAVVRIKSVSNDKYHIRFKSYYQHFQK